MIKARKRKRDGRQVYDVRLRDPDGKVYTRTFETKRAAEDFEVSERSSRLRGTWVDVRKGDALLSVVATAWLASNESKRASSIARDKAILKTHIEPILGKRAIGSITRADVQRLVDKWATVKAASTVGRQYSCLRALFGYAEAAEMIGRSPCRSIRLPQVRLVDRPSLDAKQLARVADKLGGQQGTMMWLGAVLGLRWAEAAGLTVGQLNLLTGTVAIDRQLLRDRTLGPPKSAASQRTVAIPKWLGEAIAAVMVVRGLTAKDADELVFVNSEGLPLDYTDWRKRTWRPACRLAGQPGLRFHDLRSIATSALVTAGVDVKTAQTRLGHSSPQVTLGIYARASASADRSAADTVGEIFRPRDGRAMDRTKRKRAARR